MPGFTIGYGEDSPLGGEIEPLSVGIFRLNRPSGLYQWQFSGSVDRLAMELNNDHHLVLHSALNTDHTPLLADGSDPDRNTIELRPGANGGVFLNGQPFVSPLGVTGGGGKLDIGNFTPVSWQALFSTPGVMAVGTDARAFGDQGIAIGAETRAGYHSVALGTGSVAQFRAMALGTNSTAINRSTAIAGSHAEQEGAVAIGPSAYATSEWSTALGTGSYAGASFALALGGWANTTGSWAGAWGTTWGNDSIALGGYAGASKSFAAASGVTYGDYSVAIGRGTVTWQHYTTVLGTLNAYTYPASLTPLPGDPLFVIGNGWVEGEATPNYSEHRSNAFTVAHDGTARIQGGLTVDGMAQVKNAGAPGATQVPTTSLFKGDVSVQGVLRVPESGDLSMGDFKTGTPP